MCALCSGARGGGGIFNADFNYPIKIRCRPKQRPSRSLRFMYSPNKVSTQLGGGGAYTEDTSGPYGGEKPPSYRATNISSNWLNSAHRAGVMGLG